MARLAQVMGFSGNGTEVVEEAARRIGEPCCPGCGGVKRREWDVCSACWAVLPDVMRGAVRSGRIGVAVAWVKERGRGTVSGNGGERAGL